MRDDRPLPFWSSLRQDVVAHVPPERRPAARWVRWTLAVALRSSGFRMVLTYRLAHTLRHRLGLLGRLPSAWLFWFGRHFYGCSLAPTARLHGGLCLPHPQGIVIGPDVELGPRGWVLQNVTIGGAPGKAGMPCIGADARLFAGAVLVGPITIGDGVTVGANAVVSRDVPSGATVRPAPVEIVTKDDAPQPPTPVPPSSISPSPE